MTTFLDDIINACKGVEGIRHLGTVPSEVKCGDGKKRTNHIPLFEINGKKVISIIRKVQVGSGEELYEEIKNFIMGGGNEIASGYIFVDQDRAMYELKKNNDHHLAEVTGKLREEYEMKIVWY